MSAIRELAAGWVDAMRNDPLPTGLFTAFVLLVLFGVAECTAGTTTAHASEILGHEFHPAYTTTTCDNKNVCSTTYHPAEWHLVVDCGGEAHSFSAGRSTYYAVKDGQRVVLSHRSGRVTGLHYLHGIVNANPHAETW